jgi:hypothetical protein
LNTGITIKSLVDDLNENGFSIEYNDFKSGLTRARRKLKTQGGNKPDIKTNDIKKPDIIKPTAGVINNTQVEEVEDEDETENLTLKQKRERNANKYVDDSVSNNPLFKKLLKENKE